MLTKRIIPCLDVTNGRVVKGTKFLELKDAGDPVELAKRYNDEGADELVFLDITASSDKRKILIHLVEETARTVFIPFTVGGVGGFEAEGGGFPHPACRPPVVRLVQKTHQEF